MSLKRDAPSTNRSAARSKARKGSPFGRRPGSGRQVLCAVARPHADGPADGDDGQHPGNACAGTMMTVPIGAGRDRR